jgi:hypothetical protein
MLKIEFDIHYEIKDISSYMGNFEVDFQLKEDIKKWCVENNIEYEIIADKSSIGFGNLDDELLFKLTWL